MPGGFRHFESLSKVATRDVSRGKLATIDARRERDAGKSATQRDAPIRLPCETPRKPACKAAIDGPEIMVNFLTGFSKHASDVYVGLIPNPRDIQHDE